MNLTNSKKLQESLNHTAPDSLIRLIYISRVSTIDDSVFGHIEQHSSVYNKDNGITGFLYNNTKKFLQCLEGKKDALLDLISRIFRDANHNNVSVVFAKQVDSHGFSD